MSETRFRILFSRGRGLLSRLVAWFVRSRLSHAAGSFTIIRVDMVMESTEKGVDLLPARRFAADNIVEAVVRPVSGTLATEDGMVSHLSWLIERHGADKYDWMAAGSVGIRNRIGWLWRLIGGWLRRRWSRSAVHCTELWVDLLRHAGYLAVKGMVPELTDPPRLLRALAMAKD